MATPSSESVQPAAKPRRHRLLRRLLLGFAVFYVLPVLVQAIVYMATGPHEHWSRADRSSIGIAPVAARTPEAVVQVYSARTHGWRSIFATHTWFALKAARATDWERFEVIGFGVDRGRPAVRASSGAPDTRWYGHDPVILAELRGAPAETAIAKLRAAAVSYPYPRSYTAWPGPNSNTFIAHLARAVPELRLDLPPTAIGKNYPVDGFFCRTPSGTGWQFTFGGFAGIAVGLEEGIEVDVLGAVAGIDVRRPALRLPGIGRLGWHTKATKDKKFTK